MADHGAIGVNLTWLPNPPTAPGGGGEVTDSFTADAILLKEATGSFTADALLIISGTGPNAFTADAVLVIGTSGSVTLDAVLTSPVIPPAPPEPVRGRLIKRTTLHILKRRELAFSAYVPPRTPDTEEGDDPPIGDDPYCLPPCQGFGAGTGTGYGAAGGPQRRTVTICSACDTYFRTESEYLGRGSSSLSGTYHCGSCGPHNRDDHYTRLFVDYLSVPQSEFSMRARMYWDQGTTSSITVDVFANLSALPAIDLDDCVASLAAWSDGDFVGSMTFVADKEGLLGGRPIQYQDAPSQLLIDGAAISTTIFKFALHNTIPEYNAKFKAANLEMTVD
jgi:hypothetical protein